MGAGNCYVMDPANGLYYNGKEMRAPSVYFQNGAGAFYKNAWHRVEAVFKLNSIVNCFA